MTIEEYTQLQSSQPVDSTFSILENLVNWSQIDFKDKSVLEVGCGNDMMMNLVKKRGAKEIRGLDIHPTHSSFEVTQGYQEELPFEDEAFDVYISSHTLEHSYDFKKTISEMHRVLKKDGVALIALPYGIKHSDSPVHMAAINLGLTAPDTDKVLKNFGSFKIIDSNLNNYLTFVELRILLQK